MVHILARVQGKSSTDFTACRRAGFNHNDGGGGCCARTCCRHELGSSVCFRRNCLAARRRRCNRPPMWTTDFVRNTTTVWLNSRQVRLCRSSQLANISRFNSYNMQFSPENVKRLSSCANKATSAMKSYDALSMNLIWKNLVCWEKTINWHGNSSRLHLYGAVSHRNNGHKKIGVSISQDALAGSPQFNYSLQASCLFIIFLLAQFFQCAEVLERRCIT